MSKWYSKGGLEEIADLPTKEKNKAVYALIDIVAGEMRAGITEEGIKRRIHKSINSRRSLDSLDILLPQIFVQARKQAGE
ncbi:MAG: hypothetical protein JW834_03250 [Candidatus Diapherotrites archaeon]|nr:hypothetical protein [Candidatus Diapherotrites archaeon]